MSFSHRLAVRYADTDAQGVVFFANYLTYFDEGLTYFLEHIGHPYSTFDGGDFVYVNSQCTYKGSATFGDHVDVEVVPTRVGRTSLTSRCTVRRGDEVLAEGELVNVYIGADRRPKALPDALRAALEAHRR